MGNYKHYPVQSAPQNGLIASFCCICWWRCRHCLLGEVSGACYSGRQQCWLRRKFSCWLCLGLLYDMAMDLSFVVGLVRRYVMLCYVTLHSSIASMQSVMLSPR